MIVSGLAIAIASVSQVGSCADRIDCVAAAGMPVPVVVSADQGGHNSPLPLSPLIFAQAGTLDDQAVLEGQEQTDPAPASDEIIVSGEIAAPAGDPGEKVNAKAFEAAQAVDQALVEPVANAYSSVIPEPIRDGVRNFLSNLGEPINFLHSLLQLKPKKAIKTLGRFAINTTLGIGGVFDQASKEPFNIERQPNGLANTLGYYGVGPGPYLYLPLIGSTTVRDLIGRVADLSLLPAVVGKPLNDPYYAIPAGTIKSLNDRLEVDDQIDAIREKCGDPYAASRDIYLLKREAEINALRGRENARNSEISDRLEFNCDIEIVPASEAPDGVGGFVVERTTLVEDGAETPEEQSAPPEADAPMTGDEGETPAD